MHALRPLYLLLAVTSVAALPLLEARADIVHTVHFKTEARIIVWGETQRHQTATNADTIAPKMQQTAYKRHQTAHALRLPLVQTGHLLPIRIDASPLEVQTSSEARFHVASNTGFAIKAELSSPLQSLQSLQDTPFTFALSDRGSKAVAPAAGETGYATHLGDLITPTIIYRSPMATAARAGSIRDQSLAFHAQWGQSDRSGPIDITFTVFQP